MSKITAKGSWNASTNTPNLSDATGTDGWVYNVGTAGTVDLGSGPVSYLQGDSLVFNGSVWEKIPGGLVTNKAANYDSLAAFAAKSGNDWSTQLRDAEITRWGSSGVLGALFTGLEQGKPFIVALLQAIIHQAFVDITDVFNTVETAFDAMRSNFSGKWRDILAAQDAADYANAQLAVMNRLISDLFDGASGDLSGNWNVSYSVGAGGGKIQQDGRGNCWWDAFGGIPRTGKAIWNAEDLTTDKQVISTVMPLRVQDPKVGSDSYIRLLGRSNNAGTGYVYAEIGADYCAVGYALAGLTTELDRASTATSNGDSWDFYIGTATSDYEFVLKRNGVALITVTDSAPASNKGAGYLSVGFVMHAADRNLFLAQTSPGKMAMFSADDQ